MRIWIRFELLVNIYKRLLKLWQNFIKFSNQGFIAVVLNTKNKVNECHGVSYSVKSVIDYLITFLMFVWLRSKSKCEQNPIAVITF